MFLKEFFLKLILKKIRRQQQKYEQLCICYQPMTDSLLARKEIMDEVHHIYLAIRYGIFKTLNQVCMGLDVFGVCEQQRCRPACTSVQTDQHLCYSLFGKYHI